MKLIYENNKLKNKIENIETKLTTKLARKVDETKGQSEYAVVKIS